jgi:hypothetical protein
MGEDERKGPRLVYAHRENNSDRLIAPVAVAWAQKAGHFPDIALPGNCSNRPQLVARTSSSAGQSHLPSWSPS